MPLTGNVHHDIKKLYMENKKKGKPRKRDQIVAIALSEARRKKYA